MIFVTLAFAAAALQQPIVPRDLWANGKSSRVWTKMVDDDNYTRADVSIHTASRELSISWRAQAGAGTIPTTEVMRETVTYDPVAAVRSRVQSGVLFIAGRSASGPVLERWDLGCTEAEVVTTPSGTPGTPLRRTVLTAPAVKRSSLPIDSSLGNISDIATNWLSGVPAAQEEIWVLEWESRDVYSIDSTTGAKTLVIDGSELASMRSMQIRDHSVYGATVILMKKDWWSHNVLRTALDRRAYYDQDYDGTFDGAWDIPNSGWGTHPLLTNGQFR